MTKPRSSKVKSRNVRLIIETYEKLDKYLIELISEKGERKLTLNDAVASLLEEHYERKRE